MAMASSPVAIIGHPRLPSNVPGKLSDSIMCMLAGEFMVQVEISQ